MGSEVEQLKLLGNEAVAKKDWECAENYYSQGLDKLGADDVNIKVVLLSNRSFAKLNGKKFQGALDDAKQCIELDPNFEKGYIRCAAALEALDLKNPKDLPNCPVHKCLKEGLSKIPSSSLISSTINIMFPVEPSGSEKKKSGASGGKSAKGVAKVPKESCSGVVIRGAYGVHELRVNGSYSVTDEYSGGWPIYKKTIIPHSKSAVYASMRYDEEVIIEYNSVLEEWMIKHKSWQGSRYCFARMKCQPPVSLDNCSGTWQSVEEKKSNSVLNLNIMKEANYLEAKVMHYEHIKNECKLFELRGCNGINGVYAPTDVERGGWPLYVRIASSIKEFDELQMGNAVDPNILDSIHKFIELLGRNEEDRHSNNASPESQTLFVMEYYPYSSAWQIKQLRRIGTPECFAQSISTVNLSGNFPYITRVNNKFSSGYPNWDVWGTKGFRYNDEIYSISLDDWRFDDAYTTKIWENREPIYIELFSGNSFRGNISGIYEPTDDFFSGYFKRTDPTYKLIYCRRKHEWQIRQHSLCLSFATLKEHEICLPHSDELQWSFAKSDESNQLGVSSNFNYTICTYQTRVNDCKLMYADLLRDAVPIDIRGASGAHSFKINGIYEPTLEIFGGCVVYQRKGSNEYWLEYNVERGQWQIKNAANRGMDSAFAYMETPPKRPELCNSPWWVFVGNKILGSSNGNNIVWEIQSDLTLMTLEQRHKIDLANFEARRGECVAIDIRGATGPRSNGLNGVFVPTDEMKGGWPVYQKRDDSDWWLEYDAYPQKWMVRPTSCRGTTRGRAYILSEPDLRPEQVDGVWRLSDGKGGWVMEFSVVVRPESEAKLMDLNEFQARLSRAVPIDIRGIMKPLSYLNGVYEPQNEYFSGWPVYKQRGSQNQWLEYNSSTREWQLKPTCCKGTKKSWGFVVSDPTHPELVTGGTWTMFVDGKHVKQETVTVLTLDQRIKEDRAALEQRRSSCMPIEVSGAEGMYAQVLNGIYEPSSAQSSGGWPSYLKRGSHIAWLEYNAYATSWTISSVSSIESAQPAKQPEIMSPPEDSVLDSSNGDGNETLQNELKPEQIDVDIAGDQTAKVGKILGAQKSFGYIPILLAYQEISARECGMKSLRAEQCKDINWKILINGTFSDCPTMTTKLLSASLPSNEKSVEKSPSDSNLDSSSSKKSAAKANKKDKKKKAKKGGKQQNEDAAIDEANGVNTDKNETSVKESIPDINDDFKCDSNSRSDSPGSNEMASVQEDNCESDDWMEVKSKRSKPVTKDVAPSSYVPVPVPVPAPVAGPTLSKPVVPATVSKLVSTPAGKSSAPLSTDDFPATFASKLSVSASKVARPATQNSSANGIQQSQTVKGGSSFVSIAKADKLSSGSAFDDKLNSKNNINDDGDSSLSSNTILDYSMDYVLENSAYSTVPLPQFPFDSELLSISSGLNTGTFSWLSQNTSSFDFANTDSITSNINSVSPFLNIPDENIPLNTFSNLVTDISGPESILANATVNAVTEDFNVADNVDYVLNSLESRDIFPSLENNLDTSARDDFTPLYLRKIIQSKSNTATVPVLYGSEVVNNSFFNSLNGEISTQSSSIFSSKVCDLQGEFVCMKRIKAESNSSVSNEKPEDFLFNIVTGENHLEGHLLREIQILTTLKVNEAFSDTEKSFHFIDIVGHSVAPLTLVYNAPISLNQCVELWHFFGETDFEKRLRILQSIVRGVNHMQNHCVRNGVLMHRNLTAKSIFVDPSTLSCIFTDFSKAKEVFCINKVDDKFIDCNFGSPIDGSDMFSAVSFFASNRELLSSVLAIWGMDIEYFDVQTLKLGFYGIQSDLFSLAVIMTKLFPELSMSLTDRQLLKSETFVNSLPISSETILVKIISSLLLNPGEGASFASLSEIDDAISQIIL